MSPVGLCCLLFVSVLTCSWVPAGCYANGKVTKVCGSMEPHHRVPGQTTQSPYRLETNSTTFSPGDQIQVILSGTEYFEGFLLQARDAANEGSVSTVGTFTLTNPKKTQLLTCDKHQGSAVSHTSDATQTEVVVIWNAPTDAPRQVQFFVTVVSHYNVFWVKLHGPIIYQHGVTSLPPQSDTTPPPVQTTTSSLLPGPFASEGCGQSKSCLQDPPGCDPKQDPDCFFLSMTTEGPDRKYVTSTGISKWAAMAASWFGWVYGQELDPAAPPGITTVQTLAPSSVVHLYMQSVVHMNAAVMFELSGPAEGYVAFALSWDTWMGNDDVYMCVKDGDRVSVSAASVSGRTSPEDQSQSALSLVSWRLADGAIQCRFSRPVKLTNQEPARFDLDQEYFLFLVNGHAQYGKIWKHSRQPLVSTQRKHITGPPEGLRGSRGPMIMKMHGTLMLLAWMLTGSVGTFIASFYKPDWPNQTVLGQKVWFQFHRGLMMLTVTLTIVAFSLPFFYRKGWSKHAGVHPYLGCCVLALSLIQPMTAALRPSADSHRRYIFNWAHWGVGSVTEIMAVAAMFLGMRQSSLLLPQPWATHVLIGYVTWLASFRFLLLMHKHLYIKASSGSDDTQAILSDQSEQSRWGSFIKSLTLAALSLGNSGLLMALLSSIVEI